MWNNPIENISCLKQKNTEAFTKLLISDNLDSNL